MTRSALLAALPVLLVACGGDDEPSDTTPTPQPMAVTLGFSAVVGDGAVACGVDYEVGASTAQLADARFFVSNVELRVDGEWQGVLLDETDWQHSGVALLDFEDGSAACADSGTSDLNDVLTGELAVGGAIDAVRFDVGIPFELNHLDSATAPSPLNTPGMFWAWQGGYKFVRVDWAVSGADRWNVHLGSTGCVSDAPTKAPENECGSPNRATIELAVDPTSNDVVVDLAELVAGADIASNVVDSPPGCMSSPTEGEDCADVFANLGLDFATGQCLAGDCSGQGTFR